MGGKKGEVLKEDAGNVGALGGGILRPGKKTARKESQESTRKTPAKTPSKSRCIA